MPPSSASLASPVPPRVGEPSSQGPAPALAAYPREAAPIRRLDLAAECALARTGAAGRARLVTANLRLVAAVARRHLGRGLELDDLVQEGNLGLLRAAERFDPDRGCRFSTYAIWWIRQAISEALADRGRAVRLPAHVHARTAAAARARERLRQTLGREPTRAEVAVALDLPTEDLDELELLPQATASLEAPLPGNADQASLVDLLPDPGAAAPEVAAERAELRRAVRAALAGLTERERRVLELRHGLDGAGDRTLADVGAILGVTRQRARVLEAKALAKLRRPAVARPLLAACGAASRDGTPPRVALGGVVDLEHLAAESTR